jgi:hypothetical protein
MLDLHSMRVRTQLAHRTRTPIVQRWPLRHLSQRRSTLLVAKPKNLEASQMPDDCQPELPKGKDAAEQATVDNLSKAGPDVVTAAYVPTDTASLSNAVSAGPSNVNDSCSEGAVLAEAEQQASSQAASATEAGSSSEAATSEATTHVSSASGTTQATQPSQPASTAAADASPPGPAPSAAAAASQESKQGKAASKPQETFWWVEKFEERRRKEAQATTAAEVS